MFDNSRRPGPQLAELVRPIPAKFIHKTPDGADYVPHWVYRQALLRVVGAYDWKITEILRGHVPTQGRDNKWPAMDNAVVGCVGHLTVTIDGYERTVVGEGSCTAGSFEWNDGERLKKASSDAFKRACSMGLGLALHLWCKTPDEFFLAESLRSLREGGTEDSEVVVGVETDEGDSEPVVVQVYGSPPSKGVPSAEDRTATAKQEATAMLATLERAGEPQDDEPSVWRITAEGFIKEGIPATVHKIEYATRMLYGCMEREGVWPIGEFRRRLAECDNAEHYADLGRKKIKVAFLQEALDRAATDLGGGEAVSPSVDPPPTADVDPFDGIVLPSTHDVFPDKKVDDADPGEAWDELKVMLSADPSKWPAPLADAKARDLFKLMRRVGLWADGAWKAAQLKHEGDDPVAFAVSAWEAARVKVNASQ